MVKIYNFFIKEIFLRLDEVMCMSFEEEIKIFCAEIPNKYEHIKTEETTKISLVLPFLRLMGYDDTDPTEVQAEYTADIGSKQGEKVDFAILKDNNVEIIIECKSIHTTLEEKHLNQLLRYYMTTDARLGILTNGLIYQFYTDSDENGKMDNTPFFEINFLNFNSQSIKRLKKLFYKNNFDINQVSIMAKELKHNRKVKKVLLKEFENPSEEFTKTIAKQVYNGVLTPPLNEKFSQIIHNKIKEIIDEKANTNKGGNTLKLEKQNLKKRTPVIKQSENTGDLFLEYWNKVHDYLEEHNHPFKYSSPHPRNYYDLSFGTNLAHISLKATIVQSNTIGIHVRIKKNSNEIFDKLFQEKELIELEMGLKLEWNKLEDKQSSKIGTTLNMDLKDKNNWDESIKWHLKMAEKIYSVFSHRLKEI